MLVRVQDAVLMRGERGAPILAGVSCTVHAGEFVMLVGANGAGKSTLARTIAGLVELDAGTVQVATGVGIGFVHQDPWAQVLGQTVVEDVAFAVSARVVDAADLHDRVVASLTALGIAHLAWREPATLSGGQLQRVAIAGALAARPAVLVLDEPTSFLDGQARRSLLERISALVRQGVGVLWVTQRSEDIAYATRVIAMEQGAIVYDGSPWQLMQDAHAAARAGIGQAPATRCAAQLRDCGAWSGALPLSLEALLDGCLEGDT